MKISPRGIEFIKEGEAWSAKPYQCPAGVWTIGWGHTRGVTAKSQPISKEVGEMYLREDLRIAEHSINSLVKVPLTQSQYDALVSFVFNVGAGQDGFAGSTLLKKLNKGDYDSVPAEMARWNKVTVSGKKKKSKGLVNRRAKEAALWVDDAWEAEAEPTPQGNIKRDTPTIVNPENVNAAAAVATGVGAMNLDGSNPLAWALAIIAVMTAAVFLFLFLKRRGA